MLAELAPAQQTSTVNADDAQSVGLTFFPAAGWQQSTSDPYSATLRVHGITISFYTELYTASPTGAFDSETTEDVVSDHWGDGMESAHSKNITAASADGVEVEWPGSRVERWFRISNDRFLVERCLTNGVSATMWTNTARPACEAQFTGVVLTASTLPPSYRAAEPEPADSPARSSEPGSPAAELARIPGGKCHATASGSETSKIASLLRHGERADTPADQFACWETASELGSPDAMTKIGQLFLERDQLHQSEQDRMAGVVWLLVAADRYNTLMRITKDLEIKARYQQRVNTIMDLVAALKTEKLSAQQFDLAVTQASTWKRSNMRLFQ